MFYLSSGDGKSKNKVLPISGDRELYPSFADSFLLTMFSMAEREREERSKSYPENSEKDLNVLKKDMKT